MLNKFYAGFDEIFSSKILQEKREIPSTTDLLAPSPKYEGKIIYSEIVQSPQFYLDEQGFFAEATSFILNGKNLHYLLGMLNSKLITFAFKNFYAGGGLGEKGYRYKKAFLERLPIPKLKRTQEEEFVQIIKEILESKKVGKDIQDLELRLDSMIFDLYGLSELERQLVNPPPPAI